jgi:hypothetical protein
MYKPLLYFIWLEQIFLSNLTQLPFHRIRFPFRPIFNSSGQVLLLRDEPSYPFSSFPVSSLSLTYLLLQHTLSLSLPFIFLIQKASTNCVHGGRRFHSRITTFYQIQNQIITLFRVLFLSSPCETENCSKLLASNSQSQSQQLSLNWFPAFKGEVQQFLLPDHSSPPPSFRRFSLRRSQLRVEFRRRR